MFSLFALGSAVSASAQSFSRPSVGVAVGLPLTSDFQPSSPEALPYTGKVQRRLDFPFLAGAMINVPIGHHLSLEFEGLYRRLRFPDDPSVVVTWELPLLARYRFSFHMIKPVVEAGPSFRLTGNLNSSNPSHYGATVGIGDELRLKRLRITPTIRYTHWAADGRPIVSPPTLTQLNQVEFLVGLSF